MEEIKKQTIALVTKHFGEKVASSFADINEQEPLPLFLNQTLIILGESIGRQKAIEEINYVLIKNHRDDLMLYE